MSDYQEYIVRVSGSVTTWKKEGKLHREGGPAIEHANGDKYWYKDGKRHREDGPAIEHAYGYKIWYKEGKIHREDGPAVEYANGYKAWYLDGKEYSKTEYLTKIRFYEGKVVEIEGHKYKLVTILG